MWAGIDWTCCCLPQGPAFFPGLSGFCQSFQFPLLWVSLSLFSFPVAPLGPSFLSLSPGPWELSFGLFSWDFFQKLVLFFTPECVWRISKRAPVPCVT